MIRDFIYERTKDKEYAYGAPKTITKASLQKQLTVPLPENYIFYKNKIALNYV